MGENKNNCFESIYHQHYPMVLQMCLGFVKGDTDAAKDLSQEIFINVWTHLESFKGLSSYKTWIYRITVNTCLQYLKKDKKERILLTSETDIKKQILDTEAYSNDENLELYKAIGQLKRIDRLIIMMVLEDQDYDYISEVMGISAANVRVKIHRIKKRLKTILKNIENE